MPTLPPIDEPSPAPTGGESRTSEVKDGRQLRRLRNIEAVRTAILDLHVERAPLDLDTVAERAGVTVRSIYRYYADLDAAIDDALEARLEEAYRVWHSQVLPSPDEPLATRIDVMLGHRMEIERLGRPLRNVIQKVNPDPEFDRQVCEVFALEFSWLEGDELDYTRAAVCYLLRPRGLRSMMEFPQHGGADPRASITFVLRRLLATPPVADGEPAPGGTFDSRHTN